MPEAIEQIRGTASLIVPEIILLATACVLFLVGPFMVSDAGEAPCRPAASLGIFVADRACASPGSFGFAAAPSC